MFSFFFAGGCQYPYGTAPGHSSMEVKSAELELLISGDDGDDDG